jgi:pyridoxamine 5'-phosphate oxidase family protein
MSNFSKEELDYLQAERRLGRVATTGRDGTPHVTPVGWSLDADGDAIEVGGSDLANTKKFHDVERNGRAAIVIDDLASTDPWWPRGVEVRGRAEAIDGDRPRIRIHADRVRSWGLED